MPRAHVHSVSRKGSYVTLLLSSHTASLTRRTRHTRTVAPSVIVLAMTLASLFSNTFARAELADDYLFALRERGWHDTALEYLDSSQQDPLASDAFLKKVPYEQAVTQVALARSAPSDKQRQQALAEAAAAFQGFAAAEPNSPLQLQALATSGNLLTELALSANNKAENLPAAARKQREQLNTSARDFLDQAKQPLSKLQEQCQTKIAALPKAAELQNSRPSQANRQQLEGKLAEAKFLLAKLEFEKARTYEPDSKARTKALKTSATAFAKLYEEYEDKLVGFYARFYEGRSKQAAGKIEEALECYLDIVDQPPIPNQDFRRLVSRAYRYRTECHLASNEFDQAIEECREWLEEASGPELTQPDWLAVSYQLATTYEAKAAASSGGDAQRAEAEARKLYREIARQPGEFQREAKAKIAAGGSQRKSPQVVKSFEEAFRAGKDALQQMNSAKMAVRLAAENNPDSVRSLEEQAEAEQLAAAAYFRQAIQLADDQADRDQLGNAHYFLCWLYWEQDRLDEAAVLGEFLSRRFPENNYARVAAKLALAAYERLYNQSRQANESSNFAATKLTEVAELLIQRWPDSEEAAAGLNLLINIALRDNRLADAEARLERLPPASRAGAELRLGGALWTRYLRASSGSQAEPDEQAKQLKEKAGKLLANGFEAIKSKPSVNAVEATGALYYSQLLLSEGQADQAVAALEDPNVGPLTLIKGNSAVAENPQFVQEAYKVGLRAYLSTEPPQREQAQAMMSALESALGNQADAEQKLISIYVSLGLQLQQQISDLTAAGQAGKARAVANSFADLLARVTERAGAADNWKIQSWIAQTNLQLGQGLSGEDATEYFEKAEQAYQTLLDKAKQNPKFAPSPISILATKKKLADCQLAMGNYDDAFQQYALILKGKPNMLELQQAAAAALQKWGADDQQPKRLEEAIRGAMPQANRKNLVWGWLRIAAIADQAKRRAEKQAASDPKQAARAAKYEDLFFKARYHAAEARFLAAKLSSGADRTKQLGTARQSLASMQRLYPDLGGPKWQSAYQKLIQQMDQLQ